VNAPTVRQDAFGRLNDGTAIEQYTLSNGRGMEVRALTYGGIIASIMVPDRDGRAGNVVLGFDTLEAYVARNPYFGAIAGRYANRIAKASFTLDGKAHALSANEGANTLHGGKNGFDKRVWRATPLGDSALVLEYLSPDGEEGFPGNLALGVVYTVTPEHELRIDYTATTDQATVVNLTSHSYFNLAGQGNGDILGHQLTLHASKFTPVDAGLIPTGELKSVTATPFDFLKSMRIGDRIEASDEQIKLGGGYDHNWVLDSSSGKLAEAAEVYEPTSGRVLKVSTTEPGIQFYSGNFLIGAKGKDGKPYPKRSALCLETQHYPDSPNHSAFPSTELKPGQKYHSVTVFNFSAR